MASALALSPGIKKEQATYRPPPNIATTVQVYREYVMATNSVSLLFFWRKSENYKYKYIKLSLATFNLTSFRNQ